MPVETLSLYECVFFMYVCVCSRFLTGVGSSPRLEGNPLPRLYHWECQSKSVRMMHAVCWRHVRMFKEYLGLAEVPEPCFRDIRVQFMMIGRYTYTQSNTHLQAHTHKRKATEARPDKQIIWRKHHLPYEYNNWFHYLVGISATLNEVADSVWYQKQAGVVQSACLGPVFTWGFF